MLEKFQLSKYGGLSLMEQNWMTAQDRAKWFEMTEKDLKDRAEAEKKQSGSRSPRRH